MHTQLENANLMNLTNLWKLMGATNYPTENTTIYVSADWPHRLWWHWDSPIDVAGLGLILSDPQSKDRSFTLPLWTEPENLLNEVLHDKGFNPYFKQTAMVLDINNWTANQPSKLAFHTFSETEDVTIWTQTASASFGYYVVPAIIKNIVDVTEISLVLASLGNIPVGTALLFQNSGVMGIHLVGVLPNFRGQGFATQIMHHCLGMVHRTKCDYITLQASVMGESIYRKLGFTKQFTITNYSNI